MTQRKTKAYIRRRRKIKALIRLGVTVILFAAVIVGAVTLISKTCGGTRQPEEVVYKPGPPQPAVASSATIASTGDILIHDSVRYGAETENGFDFSESFAGVAGYWGTYDYMIANLEVPCGGEESGEYRGYPGFNAPDEIVRDLKNAGVDMLLTANNHAYDCGEYGLVRTQDVIKENGLDYVGTRQSSGDSYVLIKDINGIKFGFACYTYDTRQNPDDWKSLNGITMSEGSVDLINSFTYSDLDSLYNSIDSDLRTMEAEKCDVTVFFMHWGDEYRDNPNEYQTEIAQRMCNMGVDLIIGGHPHVIQEMQVLHSELNDGATICLYSMGNALSSQRKEIMDPEEPRGYTEDGLTISVAYEKFNNGKIKLKEVSILPTWVDVRGGVYSLVALDQSMITSKWQTANLDQAIESYNRTLGRVGPAYPALRDWLGNAPVKESVE